MGCSLAAGPVAFVLVFAGCGGGGGGDDDGGIDAPPSAACQEATTYQELATIETKIFKPSCVFSGCHNGAATPQGMMDIRETKAFTHLVNVDSKVSTDNRKVVVPGDPESSYMMIMIGEIAPGDATPPGSPPPTTIGFMPQNAGSLLCNEKREAIKRWITAGAQDN